ncbi:MAG: TSUP family transporter [Desulfococcaceae bacterium]|jgi:uncharacterized membrane protein YfcA|nr:TSUP family transporter [Desulfococcaceae bacterium]
MPFNTFPLSPEILTLLFLSGLMAGFVDSIAGGGGLITLPVLLSAGIPPQLALGTNKLQGSFGTLSSAYNFIRKKQLVLKETLPGIIYTFIGAAAGAAAVQCMNPDFIRHLIPVLLLLVLLYTFYSKNLGYADQKAKMKRHTFFIIFGIMLGFYDGFFGPGTGSFWTAALCILMGFNMTKAAAYTRVMNFTSNIVALILFICGGNVLWIPGICMAMGQIIGARIGSDMAIRKGAAFIRPIFMGVVGVTIIRLIYVNYFGKM